MKRKYFIHPDDVDGYHPANHIGTLNKRLIGPENAGARQLELVLGQIESGKGALPHTHPGIEQICYMLEGRAVAEVAGESKEIGPGECCFFPANMPHAFTVVGERPVKVLVIYSPPYGEDPTKVVR
jgi:mannose-6-phosphate isomerase-like protein (cupin superfamily)